jgi:hypothetical protein
MKKGRPRIDGRPRNFEHPTPFCAAVIAAARGVGSMRGRVNRETELAEIEAYIARRGAKRVPAGFSGAIRAALPLLEERRRIRKFKPKGPTAAEWRRAFLGFRPV